jgi:hypothetical protein
MTRAPHRQDAHCAGRNSSPAIGSANRRRWPSVLTALTLVAWWCGPSYAIDIVAIEEHWQLSVGEPDAGSSSPQVCMVMSPTGDLNSDYFMFTINHKSSPEFSPGGMQVQQWCGDDFIDARVGPNEETLSNSDEVISWVQRTELHDGSLTFEVVSGESSTWGQFGSQGYLRLVIASYLNNLNGYRPAVSLNESGVSYAGNRVRSLTLTKIRWFDSAGNAYELNAPIDIDADLDP